MRRFVGKKIRSVVQRLLEAVIHGADDWQRFDAALFAFLRTINQGLAVSYDVAYCTVTGKMLMHRATFFLGLRSQMRDILIFGH